MSDLKIKAKNLKNSLQRNGIKTEIRRGVNFVKYKKPVLDGYIEWQTNNEPSIEKLKQYKFSFRPKFLVVTPDEETKNQIGEQNYKNYAMLVDDINNVIAKVEEKDADYFVFIGKGIKLQPFALYSVAYYIEHNNVDVVYSDNDYMVNGNRVDPDFKPHYAYDTLLSKNYFGNFLAIRKDYLIAYKDNFKKVSKSEGIYDIALRCTENYCIIKHIDMVLYHKLEEFIDTEEQKNIIKAHLDRIKVKYDSVEDGAFKGQYKINYKILKEDKISIVIPNMDHIYDLEKCVKSIEKSTYKNYEIVIIENNSKKEETFEFYKKLEKKSNIKVVKMEINEFNYAKIVNFGVKNSSGEYVLMLNNDIEILSKDWLEQMLMYAQREDVGIVGARLYFEDDTIQHAGVTIGIRGLAGHRYREFAKSDFSAKDNISYVQDLSAVTAACFLVSRKDWNTVLGFDEKLAVAFNDVDFCMKIRKMKKLVVYNPFVEAYHYESKSRGEDTVNKEKQERFANEYAIFVKRWGSTIAKGDPYFNKNYRLDTDIPTINYNKI